MGTNYYFYDIHKKKETDDANKAINVLIGKVRKELADLNLEGKHFAISAISALENLKDDYDLTTQIHIAKLSAGWKPLFATPYENQYYDLKSMEEWYLENKNHLSIQDEYGIPITWEALKEKLLHRAGKSHVNEDEYGAVVREDGTEWVDYEFS